MSQSGQPRYRVNPDTVANRVGDVIVLVQLNTDRIFSLNRTASRLWELIAAGLSAVEIRKQLLGEFTVAEAQLDQEIEEIIESLTKERFIMAEE